LVLATCALAGLVGIGLAPGLVTPDSAGFANLLGQREGAEEANDLVESTMTLDGQVIRIGAKGFTEQFILAEVLRERIRKVGGTPEVLTNMGSTIVFDALAKNTIDIYIDYTGTLWSTVLKELDPINRISMRAAVAGRLFDEFGIVVVGSLGFENTYALVAKRETVARYGLSQIGDITPAARDLRIGGDPEFFGRPEWQRVRQLYSLGDITEVGMDSTFMYQAVADGQVDVAAGFSTDGRIDAFDLAVLKDPKQAFPPYDAVILLSPEASKNKNLVHAIEPLVNRISVTAMRTANRLVDEGGETPKEAAGQLLPD
jgi:osmoprotectant transport system permease protein